jgi:NAD(P)-dependent dehydrogenase (short-subunit alcohol dehydrogenase family)
VLPPPFLRPSSALPPPFLRPSSALPLPFLHHRYTRFVCLVRLQAGGTALAVPGVDATDSASVSRGFRTLHEAAGTDPVDVLVYNAGAFQRGRVEEISVEDFERCWKANCLGALASVKEVGRTQWILGWPAGRAVMLCTVLRPQVLPAMQARKRGTILLTGATAALRGSANFSCLAVGKFGLRGLAQSLARENQKDFHIHVAHVIIDGMVDLPRTRSYFPDKPVESFLNPEAVAEEYWRLHTQVRRARSAKPAPTHACSPLSVVSFLPPLPFRYSMPRHGRRSWTCALSLSPFKGHRQGLRWGQLLLLWVESRQPAHTRKGKLDVAIPLVIRCGGTRNGADSAGGSTPGRRWAPAHAVARPDLGWAAEVTHTTHGAQSRTDAATRSRNSRVRSSSWSSFSWNQLRIGTPLQS